MLRWVRFRKKLDCPFKVIFLAVFTLNVLGMNIRYCICKRPFSINIRTRSIIKKNTYNAILILKQMLLLIIKITLSIWASEDIFYNITQCPVVNSNQKPLHLIVSGRREAMVVYKYGFWFPTTLQNAAAAAAIHIPAQICTYCRVS